MEAIVVNITLIGIILFSAVFHEVMHAYVGLRLGDDTALRAGRLTLNPLRHIDPFMTVLLPFILALLHLPIFGAAKPVPFNPHRVRGGDMGAALVAVSGPLTNFLLAVVFGLPLRFFLLSQFVTTILAYCVLINLGFFLFNLLPLPPLDGSRVLYAFAPDSLRSVMRSIENSGLLGVAVFIFLFSGILAPYFLASIGFLFQLITGARL